MNHITASKKNFWSWQIAGYLESWSGIRLSSQIFRFSSLEIKFSTLAANINWKEERFWFSLLKCYFRWHYPDSSDKRIFRLIGFEFDLKVQLRHRTHCSRWCLPKTRYLMLWVVWSLSQAPPHLRSTVNTSKVEQSKFFVNLWDSAN